MKSVYALAAKGKLRGVRHFGRSLRIYLPEALGQPVGVASLAEASGLLTEE